jgi:phage terminase small subunit
LRKTRQEIRAEIEAKLSEQGMTLDDFRLKPDGITSYRRRALSQRQYKFVEEYLVCGNATEAARRAGYSIRKSHNTGTRLLRTPAIRRQIEARFGESALSTNEILGRLAELASAHYDDFVVVDPESGETRVDLAAAKAAGKLHLIKRIRPTKSGVEVEFHSRLVALTQLAKIDGMLRDTRDWDWRAEVKERGINPDLFFEYLGLEIDKIVEVLTSEPDSDDPGGSARMLGPG